MRNNIQLIALSQGLIEYVREPDSSFRKLFFDNGKACQEVTIYIITNEKTLDRFKSWMIIFGKSFS